MALQLIDSHRAKHRDHAIKVRISLAVAGGWNVTGTLDGRVVALRHCRDWHQVERARILMESELEKHAADLTPTAH